MRIGTQIRSTASFAGRCSRESRPPASSAEQIAELLAAQMPAVAYHAGMSTASRDAVQAGFLAGELEVIVATERSEHFVLDGKGYGTRGGQKPTS